MLSLVLAEYEYFCFPYRSSFKQALEALPQLSSGTDRKWVHCTLLFPLWSLEPLIFTLVRKLWYKSVNFHHIWPFWITEQKPFWTESGKSSILALFMAYLITQRSQWLCDISCLPILSPQFSVALYLSCSICLL